MNHLFPEITETFCGIPLIFVILITFAHFRSQPVYTPQVEAISPTLPDGDSQAELSPFKATKDELYANINRIEREISEAETQILKLKKKQQELEASSKSSGVD